MKTHQQIVEDVMFAFREGKTDFLGYALDYQTHGTSTQQQSSKLMRAREIADKLHGHVR
jgi:uncharacterized membrane protein affecting hemolysin expression